MTQVVLPHTLTAGAAENVNHVQANLEELRDGHNDTDTRVAAIEDYGQTGGKCVIATEEAITNVAYTAAATPDLVENIVLPANGVLKILFEAYVKNVAMPQGNVAIFLNGVQVYRANAPASSVMSAEFQEINYGIAYTTAAGLAVLEDGATDLGPAIATGQVIGGDNGAAFLLVKADAGTYDVEVRYKHSVGGQSVRVKNRRLHVLAQSFG